MTTYNLFKALVFFRDQVGKYQMDAFEKEGVLWFVPQWIVNQAEQWKRPARIVSVENLQFQRTPDSAFAEIAVNEAIPEDILGGTRIPEKGSRYTVIESPDIHFPTS